MRDIVAEYENKINDLTANDLLDEDTYLIIEEMNDIQRQGYYYKLKARAKELGVLQKSIDDMYKATLREIDKDNLRHRQELEARKSIPLELGAKGEPKQTIENFVRVLTGDAFFDNVKFNKLTNAPEKNEGGEVVRWSDFDDSKARHHIESNYGLYSDSKYNNAINILFSEREYHPVIEVIEALEWDGVPRIETLLTKWLKCDDLPYTREVSRIIFAGGINRVYRPGCKFEDVPILIGTRQGEGKSTFVRWLALEDRFFREVNDMEGQRGSEAVEGAWICEISELLALTKSKEVELVKSFISRQTETYRRSYDRRISDYPRQCVFVGTTNRREFLTDRTGNRRFYPVVCNQVGYELFNSKDECQADIRQCWAEACHYFKTGDDKANPYFSRELLPEARERQNEATEEDYRVGLIEEYAKDKTHLCVIDVWENALGNHYKAPSRKDSMEIAQMLNALAEFEPMKKRMWFKHKYGTDERWTDENGGGYESIERVKVYGTQKAWKRVKFH